MTEIEAAWLAGLLEGEGCFTVFRRRPSGREGTQITLAMTDRDVVQRAADLMGTTVNLMRPARGNHNAMWRTIASSQRAEDIMLSIRPFMGTRRVARIDDILSRDLSHR